MKNYISVKMITAEECSHDQFAGAKNFGDLSKLNGGVDRHGYKITLSNGQVQWIEQKSFEKMYIKDNLESFEVGKLLPHQMRVVDEFEELKGKFMALESFINLSSVFQSLDESEKQRLQNQLLVMKAYLNILRERIINF